MGLARWDRGSRAVAIDAAAPAEDVAIASAANASESRDASSGSPEYRSVIRSNVSSSRAASFDGDQDVTDAGPRMTSGKFWPNATPRSFFCPTWSEDKARFSQPVWTE